ncbi:hypothetical protein FGO68_gene4577 [Halteria grandinella]|uniref:Rab-GAP TBC domain-containing protein n=1 Tax=Halteria grandinella TaxID=5974 RepID=A0A8J8NSR0_HALGN|nr:hypothetical protein FGO68_gene4577 [Halteria grandinella]
MSKQSSHHRRKSEVNHSTTCDSTIQGEERQIPSIDILKAQKLDEINEILTAPKINIDRLREATMTKYGLVNDETRIKVWPILLGIEQLYKEEVQQSNDYKKVSLVNSYEKYKSDRQWIKYAQKQHKDAQQIEKDILRSLNSFDVCQEFTKSTKQLKREQLSNIITGVLVKSTRPEGGHPKCRLDEDLPQGNLHYFQGYHDVVSVLLLTLGENLGFYAADALSRTTIRDYMLTNFEGGVMPLMKLLMQLLKEMNFQWSNASLTLACHNHLSFPYTSSLQPQNQIKI